MGEGLIHPYPSKKLGEKYDLSAAFSASAKLDLNRIKFDN